MEKLKVDKKAITLMALRMLIGWHLLYEGLTKLTNPNWSSIGYLKQSKGMFSGMFISMAENDTLLGMVDLLNQWGLTIIGVCLIAGLFTRVSAYAGAALLVLYYLGTPPLVGIEYSIPTEGNYLVVNKTLIEACALLVLAVFASQNYLGLDMLFIGKKQQG